ncbi:MAG: hypothetical protein AB1598_01120 [Thermodesulfobacteriota bacterium]
MRKPSFSRGERIGGAVYSLFILVLFLTAQWLPGISLAQGVFSAAEQIYLKNITPLLYEFSQAAAGVSDSLLKLQSATPEECASQFADYRGIVGSISKQLGSLTPPTRLETVHQYATQSLDGYSAGLELYFKACTEEDFGVKESLVSQGGVSINKSVVALGKAYEEIENVKAAGPAVVKNEAAEQITESDITDRGAAEYSPPDEVDTESEPDAAPGPLTPTPEVKTKAQVLAEISEKVQADMEAREEAEAEVLEPDTAVVETPTVVRPVEEATEPEPTVEEPEVKTPVKEGTPEPPAAEPAPALSENIQVKTEETPAAEPALPPSENNPVKTEQAATAEPPQEVKTEEVTHADPSQAEKDTAEPPQEVKTEEGIEKTDEDKKPDKEDIERLNQKIMEQAKAVQTNADMKETSSSESETPQSKATDEEKAAGTSAPPDAVSADNSNTSKAAPPADAEEVAALPPGEADEELKEEAPVDDVKSWCRERYQTPSEQESCMKQRAVAKDKIDKLSGKFSNGSKERGVLDKCMSDWKEGSTYNYEMVISCTQFFCTQSDIESCKDLSK